MKIFRLLSKFSRQCCQSCILLVHRNTLGKKSFLKFLMFSDQLRTLSKNLSAFYGEFLGRFVKAAFYLSIENLWGRESFLKFLLKFFVVFSFWTFFFYFLIELLYTGLANYILRVQGSKLKENRFLKDFNFFPFSDIEWLVFVAFYQNSLHGMVENAC